MSEISPSEIVKSVSEAGEFEAQQRKCSRQNPPQKDPKQGPRSGSGNSHSWLPSLLNATLPSKLAIIVGLCQVGVGGSMVLTGIFAIRYQSYMFHYGTGLWAGLIAAITGMLGVMCTKRGVPKPNWLCGGSKWQVHVFLLAILFSLLTATLLAIFSISGLLQDARTIMAIEKDYHSEVQEILEAKNTTGIFINTILLLLSILQILLCFSSLGIAVRVMFRPKGVLLSSKGSSGSFRDGEFNRGKKDHLIHWLGHQTPPALIPINTNGKSPFPMQNYVQGPHPFLLQPVMYPPPPSRYKIMHSNNKPQMILSPNQFSYGPPPTHLVPICHMTPTPSLILPPGVNVNGRRTPVSSIASLSLAQEHEKRRQQRRRIQQQQSQSARSVASSQQFKGQSQSQFSPVSGKAPSVLSVGERNNEVEVTEVDVSRIPDTYTGLDRRIAESYIETLNARKISTASSSAVVSSTHFSSANGNNNGGEDEDSEVEITRM